MPTSISPSPLSSLVICTRIHLGESTTAPSRETLLKAASNLRNLASSCHAFGAAIAVEADTEKIKDYDLTSAVASVLNNVNDNDSNDNNGVKVEMINVAPWGKFVFALNACVSWASRLDADMILFVSAETSLTCQSVDALRHFINVKTVLVVGAALPGHDYHGDTDGNTEEEGQEQGIQMELNGRTCPWNTAALWNVAKLALTGFPLVAEGLHKDEEGSPVSAGVEEVSTVALLQSVLSPTQARAILVGDVPHVAWQTSFEMDAQRQKWHEAKMKSKVARPAKHLDLLFGKDGASKGKVWHVRHLHSEGA